MMMPHRNVDDIAPKYKPVHVLRALLHNHFVNTEGGMWIVLVDALLLVPLVLAAFFYPWQSLLAGLVILVASFAGYEGWVVWTRRRHP